MAEKYFGKGKTPLSASPKNLPEIRPPSHLDSSNTLRSFSSLYSIVIVFIGYLYSIVFHPCFFEKLLSLSTEINALKSFVLEQVFVIKKTLQDIQELPNNKETNNGYVTSLTDQINFLKEENKIRNTIIQILSENQSYLSKQSEKQEFTFPIKVSQEKIKSNTQDLTNSNRFSVLERMLLIFNHPS